MGTSHFHRFWIKICKKSTLPFAYFTIFLQLNLSFAQDGRDSIRLPPLTTDAEKLAMLLKIKEKVPNLFRDAANYDIDLFALLEDEKKLLNHLKTNPKYIKLFQDKKYHEINITPPQEGLEIGEVSIDPLAIQEWKEQLKNKLNQYRPKLGETYENPNPMDYLRSEITARVQSLTQASLVDGNALLKDIGTIKANQTILNPAFKKSGSKTLIERLSTTLKIYDQLPEKPSHFSRETLEQAMELEQNREQKREDLKSLIELHSVLGRVGQNRNPTHHTWKTLEASLDELSEQDLIPFHDKKDYLKPLVDQLIPSSHPEFQKDMLNRVHKDTSLFVTRQVSSQKKARDPVTISQQHPIVGIFRGCTGGDCSSRLSFPYPNDPNEKVFFILDKDKKVKGYVSATQVMANGKPSLYVITVSGSRVTSVDTELILRGLEKEKAKLGVEQILLPAPNNIGNLINFPAPYSVYDRYTAHQPTVAIHYNHPEIRDDIQNYESDHGYNQGHYDHMDWNSQAVVLSFKNNSGIEKITTQTHELTTDSLHLPPLNSIPMSEVFEFLMDLKRSGRQKLEEKVLQIDQVKQYMNRNKYDELSYFLYEDPSIASLTVQQFKTMLRNKLSELDSSLSHYLEKNPSLVYPAVLFCTDAFSTENIDETAKQVLNHIKLMSENSIEYHEGWHDQLEKHLAELNNTKHFQKFKEKIVNQLQDVDPSTRQKAIYSLSSIEPRDLSINSTIWRMALQDPAVIVRGEALYALGKIKSTDPKIHFQILNAFQDPEGEIRRKALWALGKIKPTDPKIHFQILKALKDPESMVRRQAWDTLREIKPTNPKIHFQILKALQDPKSTVREAALFTLGEIKPTDPKIHFQILKALKDPKSTVREAALSTLGEIKPADPKIHFQISKSLKDPESRVREAALSTLGEIKPTNTKIHFQILSALTDPYSMVRVKAFDALGQIKPTDPKIHFEISNVLKNPENWIVREALSALMEIKPTDPKIHFQISKALKNPWETVRLKALSALREIKPTDPIIHLAILQAALHDSETAVRKLALKCLIEIPSFRVEVCQGLLQIAIHQTDPEERTLAIQALNKMDLSNRSVQKSLRTEISNSSKDLSDRQDLLPIIQKIMLPVYETRCQSLSNILGRNKYLKSLMDFFSNHFKSLGVSRSFHGRTGENTDLLTNLRKFKDAHVHPLAAPSW